MDISPKEIAKTLGIKLPFEDWVKKGEDFALHQVKRRTRYYCFAMRRKADGEDNQVRVPKKLIEHFENVEGFEGWKNFSRTWDVRSKNPLQIYFRNFSVDEEWDATLRRVVPELPVDRKLRRNNGE